MKRNYFRFSSSIIILSQALIACDGSSSVAPASYAFESRFQEDESSVSYSGQTLRHVLISDLTTYIGELHERVENDAKFDPSKVEPSLLGYYEFDSDTLGQNNLLISAEPELLQEVYDDVASGKDLASKVAGNDSGGKNDHKDWTKEFVGWKDESIAENGGSITSPDGLLRAFFATLENNATLQVNGEESRDGLQTHQTASGQDLKQLVQKFLLGAITFSQAADDYLDEGLKTDNEKADGDKPFTVREHAWDEAFGYFGAARDYLLQSKEDIAAGEQSDANDDDSIDLLVEFNFGASVNAAKRDVGASVESGFVEDAMGAFLEGRQLITDSGSDEEIEEQAAQAVLSWEKALAATAIHYINDVIADQKAIGSDDYSFGDHAKHWSELKGFALAFQFNPSSPLSDSKFKELHKLIGDSPVLEDASKSERSDYIDALKDARALLKKAYDFPAENVENW